MRYSSFSRADVNWALFSSAELGWIKASATSWMFHWAGSGSCMHSAKWKRAWCFQTVWSHATRCALFRRHTHTHILLRKMLFYCSSHTTDHGAQDQASRRTTKTARSCSNSNSGSGKSARHATHIKQESLTWKPAQCNGSAARQYRAAEAGSMQKMPPEAIASS